MLNKLSDIFNSGGKIAGLLSLIIVLIIPLIKLHCDNQAKEDRILDLTNAVAANDSLEAVLKDAQTGNVLLRERNSFLEEDGIKLRISHKAVSTRLRETDSKLLAYMEANSTLSLENERLDGILRGDSSGGGEVAADYVKTTPYYSFNATAYFYPKTYLQIHLFEVYDSTYTGIRFEDDTFIGFTGHTNPLIKDKGASFSYALQEVMPEYKPWGFRAGVGPGWDGKGKLVPIALAGFKYRQWGIAGFFGGDTKGLLLMRDF